MSTAHAAAPAQITLDLDATDDPLHGHQEERFFHGYYDNYCYLPLYVFCGRHLLAAKLRPANIDASAGSVEEMARIVTQIRRRWPKVRILLRANSGFAREALMAWCENNDVDFLFGLARNSRLVAEIETELAAAQEQNQKTEKPARRFKDFAWRTRNSWSRARRVVAKAEWTEGAANPRFVVTSLARAEHEARHLYEKLYCARGEMENRIKECQLDLYADRTPVQARAGLYRELAVKPDEHALYEEFVVKPDDAHSFSPGVGLGVRQNSVPDDPRGARQRAQKDRASRLYSAVPHGPRP